MVLRLPPARDFDLGGGASFNVVQVYTLRGCFNIVSACSRRGARSARPRPRPAEKPNANASPTRPTLGWWYRAVRATEESRTQTRAARVRVSSASARARGSSHAADVGGRVLGGTSHQDADRPRVRPRPLRQPRRSTRDRPATPGPGAGAGGPRARVPGFFVVALCSLTVVGDKNEWFFQSTSNLHTTARRATSTSSATEMP